MNKIEKIKQQQQQQDEEEEKQEWTHRDDIWTEDYILAVG